jgi:hypothetical protein
MNRLFFLLATLLTLSATADAQKDIQITETETLPEGVSSPQIYPTFWWVGMKYSKPELMIHFQDVG